MYPPGQSSMGVLSVIMFNYTTLGFPGGSVVKSPTINAEDAGSIPGSGRSPEKEMATHLSILAWEIPGTEEPGRLQSMWSQRVGHE